MNRTWKSIKGDSNKTKIYLVIALLSDGVFNRCSNGQSLIYPQNQVESGWNENGRSFAPMHKVIEQNLPSSLLIFPNPHEPRAIHLDCQLFPRPLVPRPCNTPITVDMDPMTISRDIFNVK